MRKIVILLFLGLAAAAVAGETPSRAGLSLADARAAVAAGVAYARAHEAPGGALAVVDDGGHLIYLERLDGSFPAAADVSIGKARTAALFRKPTRVFEDQINKGRVTMTTLPAVTGFTPLQGGVPLERDGRVVGAIGVSGAASAQQDDEIAIAAAAAFANGAEPHAVSHLEAESVERAFGDGETLVATPACTVNASRRDSPGEAEVHQHDTDIFYVLGGSATLVTGGELVDARVVAPGEIRGSAIRGGSARHLGKGDVISIPHDTPHWFKRVSGPFLYYVVKSTDG